MNIAATDDTPCIPFTIKVAVLMPNPEIIEASTGGTTNATNGDAFLLRINNRTAVIVRNPARASNLQGYGVDAQNTIMLLRWE